MTFWECRTELLAYWDRLLVDTDYVADYLKGYKAATTLLEKLVVDGIGISMIIFAEVYEGIYYGHDRSQHEQGFRRFMTTTPLLPITRSITRQFAIIRGHLRAKGLLIPDPDLYIAATAIQHHLTLVTRNLIGICPESEQVRVKLTDPEYKGLDEWIEIKEIITVLD